MPTDTASEFDLGPLSWVQGEIDQALTRGLESLAAFTASPQRRDRAQARAHARAPGGGRDPDGRARRGRRVHRRDRAAACAARGAAAAGRRRPRATSSTARAASCAIFLDELVNGAPPVPLKLFPEYEAMQAARGVKAAAPTDLFYPDLSPRAPRSRRARSLPASRLASHLVKQRRLYQRGLLAWLRGDDAGRAR